MARLQFSHAEDEATGNPIALVINGCVAGSTIIAIVAHDDAGQTVSGVSSDVSGAFTQARHSLYTGAQVNDIWYKENVAAGTHTITASFSGSTFAKTLFLIEIEAATSSALDKQNGSNTQDSANPTTPSVTPAEAGEYCVASCIALPGTSLTASGGVFTNVVASYSLGGCLFNVEEELQGTAGALNGAWTASSSSWCSAIATFKAAPPKGRLRSALAWQHRMSD